MNLEALSVDWIKQYFSQILILLIGLAVTGMHILGTLFQIKFLKIDNTYIGLTDLMSIITKNHRMTEY